MSSRGYNNLRNWRSRTKSRIIESMGGSCVCCGYNKLNSALELHHLDPSTKDFVLAGAMARPKSWDIIVNELRKCVLLCCLCHREVEAGIRSLPETYTTFDENFADYSVARPLAVCPVCVVEFDKGKTNQIYCSIKCSTFKRRKVDRPSKEEIMKLLETMSMEAVGRMFNVSGNSVRKWLKK